MVGKDIKQVPGLDSAWVEPGQSEPITFNDRIIRGELYRVLSL
jgi:hypothetical protein